MTAVRSEYRVALKATEPPERDLLEQIERLREELATERYDVAYLRGALSKEMELKERLQKRCDEQRERIYQLEAELSCDYDDERGGLSDEFSGGARAALGEAGRCV